MTFSHSVVFIPGGCLCRAEMEVLDEPYVWSAFVHLRR
jgi:hypothetical protein